MWLNFNRDKQTSTETKTGIECCMPKSCNRCEFTYMTTHVRQTQEIDKGGRWGEERRDNSLDSPTIPPRGLWDIQWTHAPRISGRCPLAATFPRDRSLLLCKYDPTVSEHTWFPPTQSFNTDSYSGCSTKEQWFVLLLGEKTKINLADLVKCCNLREISVTFESNFVHIKLSP